MSGVRGLGPMISLLALALALGGCMGTPALSPAAPPAEITVAAGPSGAPEADVRIVGIVESPVEATGEDASAIFFPTPFPSPRQPGTARTLYVRSDDPTALAPAVRELVARIDPAIHPVIPEMVESLSGRYGTTMDQVSAGWYRDGNDSVAYHGDRIARERPRSIVATVSLGGTRRFLIRPKGGGETHSFSLGHGDLVVMGGSCQRTWEHTIPKVSSAEPRIALMFRHSYD